MADTQRRATAASHPLEPLTTEEISATTEILRAKQKLKDSHKFVSVVLREPPKRRSWASETETSSSGRRSPSCSTARTGRLTRP
jgi:Cu2+-containing amine oxidase